MKKEILIFLLVLVTSLSYSQIRRGVSAYNFNPDVYIGANVGMNVFMSEGFKDYGIGKGSGMSESFFIGSNFSEILGFRAMLSMANSQWPDLTLVNNPVHKFNLQSLNAEILYNISNQFDIYNLNRPTDFQLYVGAGVVSRDKSTFQHEYMGFMLKGGVQVDFRLNFVWDINVNFGITAVPDAFNEMVTGRAYELIPELKVGITHHSRFSRRY